MVSIVKELLEELNKEVSKMTYGEIGSIDDYVIIQDDSIEIKSRLIEKLATKYVDYNDCFKLLCNKSEDFLSFTERCYLITYDKFLEKIENVLRRYGFIFDDVICDSIDCFRIYIKNEKLN